MNLDVTESKVHISVLFVSLFLVSLLVHEIGHMIALTIIGIPFTFGSDIDSGLFLAVYPETVVPEDLRTFVYFSGGAFAAIVTLPPARKIGSIALAVPMLQLGMAFFEVWRVNQ